MPEIVFAEALGQWSKVQQGQTQKLKNSVYLHAAIVDAWGFVDGSLIVFM